MSRLNLSRALVLLCSFALVSQLACDVKEFKSEEKKKVEPVPEQKVETPAKKTAPQKEEPKEDVSGNEDNSEDDLADASDDSKDTLKDIIDELLGLTDRDPGKTPGNGGDTPLILDWNRDGKVSIEFKSKLQSLLFDIDNDGALDFLEWVTPVDAMLALDRNGNGMIDSGAELFGNHSLDRDGKSSFSNGFLALASHDQNGDGEISEKDSVYSRLLVWRDTNLNGISEASELLYLAKTDVKSIRTDYRNLSGNATKMGSANSHIGQVGSYLTQDGQSHAVYDVYFHVGRRALHAVRFEAKGKLIH